MMTPAQIALYRALWAPARAVLRADGLSSADCEKRRHAIHIAVCKKDKSSLKLTNPEFDKVKQAFWAIRYPDDVDAQMRDGDAVRCWHVIGELCAQLSADEDYLQAMVDRMQREGRLRPGKRDLQVADLTPAELGKLIVALKLQTERVRDGGARPAQELLFA